MELYIKILNYLKSREIEEQQLIITNGKDYKSVTFGQEINNSVYNVMFSIANDSKSVDINVYKKAKNIIEKQYEILKALNGLNYKYKGVTFCLVDDNVCLRSLCLTDGDLETVLTQSLSTIVIATNEFWKF